MNTTWLYVPTEHLLDFAQCWKNPTEYINTWKMCISDEIPNSLAFSSDGLAFYILFAHAIALANEQPRQRPDLIMDLTLVTAHWIHTKFTPDAPIPKIINWITREIYTRMAPAFIDFTREVLVGLENVGAHPTATASAVYYIAVAISTWKAKFLEWAGSLMRISNNTAKCGMASAEHVYPLSTRLPTIAHTNVLISLVTEFDPELVQIAQPRTHEMSKLDQFAQRDILLASMPPCIKNRLEAARNSATPVSFEERSAMFGIAAAFSKFTFANDESREILFDIFRPLLSSDKQINEARVWLFKPHKLWFVPNCTDIIAHEKGNMICPVADIENLADAPCACHSIVETYRQTGNGKLSYEAMPSFVWRKEFVQNK